MYTTCIKNSTWISYVIEENYICYLNATNVCTPLKTTHLRGISSLILQIPTGVQEECVDTMYWCSGLKLALGKEPSRIYRPSTWNKVKSELKK